MPNRLIEIHDSVVESISAPVGFAVIHFSRAYLHQSDGIPGQDASTVWIQKADLRIRDGMAGPGCPTMPITILEGHIKLGQNFLDNGIPIPLDYKGAVEVRLASWNDREIIIRGTGVQLRLLGEPKFVEVFQP